MKLVVTVPEKNQEPQLLQKSHKSKNSNIVENTARKLRSKQVRLPYDQNI